MAKANAALASGGGSDKQNETILDKIATCHLKLGSNHHETEEVSVNHPPQALLVHIW